METLRIYIEQPLKATGTVGKFDIKAAINGGGLDGQAGAMRHGIARALASPAPASASSSPNVNRADPAGGPSAPKPPAAFGAPGLVVPPSAARRGPRYDEEQGPDHGA